MPVDCTEEGRVLRARVTGELDHHRAGSDSRACAQLLLHYQACGMDIPAYYRDYDLTHFCTCPRRTGRGEKVHS